ncbi:hypothetical protein B0T25DRAFT_570811 [Lasiosphaeria hispida]|uniref:Uncharacterized protein n=1 Tax=Lasiosphaeria hispida TaxID=260671 RepID=A0AAJ0HGK5_9PEZI|nr:hypothetical protein B0T25DRAFT_570811 [Lasiosphaeria hispida]
MSAKQGPGGKQTSKNSGPAPAPKMRVELRSMSAAKKKEYVVVSDNDHADGREGQDHPLSDHHSAGKDESSEESPNEESTVPPETEQGDIEGETLVSPGKDAEAPKPAGPDSYPMSTRTGINWSWSPPRARDDLRILEEREETLSVTEEEDRAEPEERKLQATDSDSSSNVSYASALPSDEEGQDVVMSSDEEGRWYQGSASPYWEFSGR